MDVVVSLYFSWRWIVEVGWIHPYDEVGFFGPFNSVIDHSETVDVCMKPVEYSLRLSLDLFKWIHWRRKCRLARLLLIKIAVPPDICFWNLLYQLPKQNFKQFSFAFFHVRFQGFLDEPLENKIYQSIYLNSVGTVIFAKAQVGMRFLDDVFFRSKIPKFHATWKVIRSDLKRMISKIRRMVGALCRRVWAFPLSNWLRD